MGAESMTSLVLLNVIFSLTAMVPTCPTDMVESGAGTCIDRYEWPNKPGVKPLLGVSGIAEKHDVREGLVMDAERLCASVGKRVCRLEEWRSACRGEQSARYPFGEKIPKLLSREDAPCNFAKFFREPNWMKIYNRDAKHMAWLDQSEPAGAREECRSASGAYDLIGNAEEWVRCGQKNKWGWCLVGRYWSQAVDCSAVVTGHSPNWHSYESTARCCLTV